MKKLVWSIAFLFLVSGNAFAQRGGVSAPDRFTLNDSLPNLQAGVQMVRQTAGLTPRNQAFNSGLKNLVLIGMGQSNCSTVSPTLFTPAHSSAIDVFNIYDGASYPVCGPLIGSQQTGTSQGNVLARLAENFVANAIFDRVIIVPICISATIADQWATGPLSDRIGFAMRRLASRGYTVGATGLTFAITWWQGESDNPAGTSQAAYTASMNTILANAQAAGFSGSNSRFFINKETWMVGAVSANVQAAQAALPNGTTFFAGGDLDSLNATYRQADNTHFNDTGAAAAAALVYNAMHASGAPFLLPQIACNDNTLDFCQAM